MAYTTLVEVRAMDVLRTDPSYTDAMIADGIAWAKARIDEETGTTWEPASRSVTVSGADRQYVTTGVVHLTAVTAATINGTAVGAGDVATWWTTPDSRVWRPDGETFPSRTGGYNVELTVTAGVAAIPDDLAGVARELARWYCLSQLSNTPSAMLQQTEWGPASVTAFGGRGRPTGMPDVNAVLRRHNHRKVVAT